MWAAATYGGRSGKWTYSPLGRNALLGVFGSTKISFFFRLCAFPNQKKTFFPHLFLPGWKKKKEGSCINMCNRCRKLFSEGEGNAPPPFSLFHYLRRERKERLDLRKREERKLMFAHWAQGDFGIYLPDLSSPFRSLPVRNFRVNGLERIFSLFFRRPP